MHHIWILWKKEGGKPNPSTFRLTKLSHQRLDGGVSGGGFLPVWHLRPLEKSSTTLFPQRSLWTKREEGRRWSDEMRDQFQNFSSGEIFGQNPWFVCIKRESKHVFEKGDERRQKNHGSEDRTIGGRRWTIGCCHEVKSLNFLTSVSGDWDFLFCSLFFSVCVV